MKTIIFTFAFSLLSCICFIGCKDKDPTKPGYQNKAPKPEYYRLRFNDEFKSYLFSKPGSYWIYKNTKTNELDTQTCTGFKVDSVTKIGDETYSKHITIQYDRLNRYVFSSFNKVLYNEKSNEFSPNSETFNNGRTIIHKIAVKGDVGTNFPIYFPIEKTNNPGAGNGSTYTTCSNIDTTILIQGQTYYNVAKFEIDKDDIWEEKLNCIRSNNIYYWAKDVGLIKKESKTCNYSWELIEHQIIK